MAAIERKTRDWQKWHDGIRCHDYKQALKVIENFYRKKRL
jgi:hypothetical protein